MRETNSAIADALVDAARELSARVERLDFAAPVSHRYNPLDYAWAPHEMYLRRYGANRKKVLFIGMNPGPFGICLLYTSPSPRDRTRSRMPSSA